MDLPKTYTELAVYVLTQFPVLGAAIGIAWWVSRDARRYNQTVVAEIQKAHLEVLTGNQKAFLEVLAEKEKRIQERDERIRELRDELTQLKSKLSRSKKPEGDNK